ncbi:uncharacterized protein LOC100569418 [Acyrthosiphon pisum]|uniref:Uncharacterized protein n=1 Tax=Acyrthosiphon pisum TaxID=7029 RepID=A0A8R1W533_ACYPI|nr:uncharacterized protein LOC100569418 [Acyrthosiphon pisum]|eukprot:XP_003243462.1 PREDICTED: uncharacterized protein LOC100569418 [Acyrthosiphon pisum]
MNKNVIIYKDCCSKLEKIASKRRIYGSESALRLNKKDSKLDVSNGNLVKESKNKVKKMPFFCASSASKSYNMCVNIQTTLSMIKQFPGQTYEDQDSSLNSSTNFIVETKLNKNSGTSLISQQSSDVQICPATSEDKFIDQEDDIVEGLNPNRWAVKQTDAVINHSECGMQKNSCSCPNRFMESYHKVMAPFMKHLRRKQNSIEPPQNPYTKAKLVQHYELLSKHMQVLKLTIVTMNNEFLTLTEKYNKLYDQHIRDQNQNLIPILLDTEDQINALRSKVEEAVDVYREAAFVNTGEVSNSSSILLADIEADQDRRPKETTTVHLSKLLRRIQCLQEKLKTGHFRHGCGDQAE